LSCFFGLIFSRALDMQIWQNLILSTVFVSKIAFCFHFSFDVPLTYPNLLQTKRICCCCCYLLSGATIRDTLIGVLRPLSKTQTHVKATGPTKAPGLLPNPEERKGLKEAQHVAHSHPSQAHRTISASLEGSGSTLERVTHLRLARGLPPGPSTA